MRQGENREHGESGRLTKVSLVHARCGTLGALWALLCVLCGSFACDSTPPPPPGPDANAGPVMKGDGVVAGRVTLVGYAHSPKQQTVKCGDHITVTDESVVTGADGGLANVIVFIAKAPYAGATTLGTAVLDQVNCRYVPHVMALQVGQLLTVKSSDSTLHNVHTLAENNKNVNFGMFGKGSRDLRFNSPEAPFRVKCDVHPWMSAHVAVFEHPYFAVTGADGSFRITGLPRGIYTLTAWHEKFHTLEQPITIDSQAPAEVRFTYRPPGT